MTVRELKDFLSDYDDNDDVVIKASNSTYVDSIEKTNGMNIYSFWGRDFNAIVICGAEQVGSV